MSAFIQFTTAPPKQSGHTERLWYRTLRAETQLIIVVTAGVLSGRAADAATPAITGVAGVVATDEVLTVSGTAMVDVNTTGWDFSESAGSFEGANYGADGWQNVSGDCAYDTTIKLMGNQSFRSDIAGNTTTYTGCPGTNSFGDHLYRQMSRYVRMYVYFGDDFESLWTTAVYTKLVTYVAPTGVYLQPSTGSTTIHQLLTIAGGAEADMNLSPPWATHRWYCLEWYVAPNGLTVWVDGVTIGTSAGTIDYGSPWPEIGIVNACPVNGSFSLFLDGVMSSTSRIYPAAKIEISTSATYGLGKAVYQAPVFLSNQNIQFKVDLGGLGAGPYFLYVTNNRQEISAAYPLSGASAKTPAPPTAVTVK